MVTTTKEAAHIMAGNDPRLTENASAKLARKQAEARRAADALNHPADAPLFPETVGAVPLATLPEPPSAAPPKPAATFTIHAALRGFPIDVAFSGSFDQVMAAVERLEKLGATPPPRPAFGGGKPPQKPLTQPLIDGDGTPCCPYHTQRSGLPTPIRWIAPRDGRPGFWGCPAKRQDVPGETINQNGYCDLRFDWPTESAPQNGAHDRTVAR